MEERRRVQEVELRVRKQQLELLKELKLLKGHLDKLEKGLRAVEEVAKVSENLERTGIRRGILNGLGNLTKFGNGLDTRLCENLYQNLQDELPEGMETDEDDGVVNDDYCQDDRVSEQDDSTSDFEVSGEEDEEDLLAKYENILALTDNHIKDNASLSSSIHATTTEKNQLGKDLEEMSPPNGSGAGQEDDPDANSDFAISGDEDTDLLEKYENILAEDDPEPIPEVAKKSYPCPTCGKVLYNYHTARDHQKTHLSRDS